MNDGAGCPAPVCLGRCRGLRPPAPPGGRATGELPGAVVAEIGLLRAAARVREIQAHGRALSFSDFLAAVVTDEHGLTCQLSSSSPERFPSTLTERWSAILRGFSRAPNAPRPQQAEQCLLLRVELQIAGADDAQMPRAEILDRSPVEILLHDRGAYVRGARHRRRIAEPLADNAHDGCDRSLLLGRGLCVLALRERDRRDERPAPGAEVLRRELLAHVLADVLVQAARAEIHELVVVAVAEEALSSGRNEELLHRRRELRVDEHRATQDSMLRPEAERDAAAAHADMALAERRDPERLVALRVALVADTEPPGVDQPHRNRRRPFEAQRLPLHVLRHRRAKLRKTLGETDELVELRLLLAGAELRVVEVLAAPRLVRSGRLELRAGTWRDPDVPPCRRDPQRVDALERRRVRDRPAARVLVPEPPRPEPPPSPSPRHRVCGVAASARS